MTHPFDRFAVLLSRQLGVPCGISLMGRPICGTDETAAHLENWQFVVGEGPAAACRDGGRSIHCANLHQVNQRFPLLATALRDAHVEEVAAVPISTGEAWLGALTLYSAGLPLQSAQLRRAERWADQLGVSVVADPAAWAHPRPEVGSGFNTAIGSLMFALSIDAPTASALIRAHAFSESISLRTLCERIVYDHFLLDLEPQWRTGRHRE